MYKINRSGPRTLPCGTPDVTTEGLENKILYGKLGVDLRDNPKKDEEKRRQNQMLPVLLVIYDANGIKSLFDIKIDASTRKIFDKIVVKNIRI